MAMLFFRKEDSTDIYGSMVRKFSAEKTEMAVE
jgi:hypothetical protein